MDSMYLGRAWFPTGQSGGTAGADVETPTSVALRCVGRSCWAEPSSMSGSSTGCNVMASMNDRRKTLLR